MILELIVRTTIGSVLAGALFFVAWLLGLFVILLIEILAPFARDCLERFSATNHQTEPRPNEFNHDPDPGSRTPGSLRTQDL